MFKNLESEMVKKGLNQKTLAEKIGMKTSILNKKMSGQAEFRLFDVQKILNVLNSELKAEYLFCEN